MRKIIEHLKTNWIKYGFETTAIIIGILGAHYLSNWKETRVEIKTEAEYLTNLVVDLENQAENILSQIALEKANQETCETILSLIHEPPYKIDSLNQIYHKMARRTFVAGNPVFEDLKYSGHLASISEPALRYSIFQYYQEVEYVETVIGYNNSNYHDRITIEILDLLLFDQGSDSEFNLNSNLSFNLKVEAFPGAETIILSQLEDEHLRFKLHNKMTFRGRLSSLQNNLLNVLLDENLKLRESLAQFL